MTNDQIEKFLAEKQTDKLPVQINFKTRESFQGIFIKTADYSELKSKNLWRIVGQSKIIEYQRSGDPSLARIFSGIEITKLGIV
jgi:hypothetical protein